jgi:hypothetical protein
MKKPFEIGDKVNVVGHALTLSGDLDSSYWVPHPGKVMNVVNGGSTLHVQMRDRKVVSVVAAGQCKLRRFKPKPKVKKEARRVWLGDLPNPVDFGVTAISPVKQGENCTEFREVLPNEIPITYEKLAEAWEEMVDNPMPVQFDWLAKSLGLERKG